MQRRDLDRVWYHVCRHTLLDGDNFRERYCELQVAQN